jgi:hypothetical protein
MAYEDSYIIHCSSAEPFTLTRFTHEPEQEFINGLITQFRPVRIVRSMDGVIVYEQKINLD